MTIGVIGLGLIGGSIGQSLRSQRHRVIGHDPLPAHVEIARQRYCVDEIGSLEQFGECEVVFLAVPPSSVTSVADDLRPHVPTTTVVTDVASVKAQIVTWAETADWPTFVPGHPMAGHEKSGPAYSSDWMFRGAKWLITPTARTEANAVKLVSGLVTQMGAAPIVMDAREHDARVALMSHVPHILSAQLLLQAFRKAGSDVGGGSWRDWSRVAGVDPDLWTQICIENRAAITHELRSLSGELGALVTALEAEDAAAVRKLFQRAAEIKASMKPEPTGPDAMQRAAGSRAATGKGGRRR
ncbi:MAG: prephenate dehydrogenase/arogenate dehydrogenase family protein [Fimbriimonadaceae bacterium]|nr:prephenate dehydrogenase/arogenate dehydrogenase family protein [Fimbriimonadaceae bacterium]